MTRTARQPPDEWLEQALAEFEAGFDDFMREFDQWFTELEAEGYFDLDSLIADLDA